MPRISKDDWQLLANYTLINLIKAIYIIATKSGHFNGKNTNMKFLIEYSKSFLTKPRSLKRIYLAPHWSRFVSSSFA